MTRTREVTAGTTAQTIRLVQVGATLSLLGLIWQFVSAGQLLSGADARSVHGTGAIVLHVVTGLALVAAVLHGRRSGTWWPAVLAAVVFLLTFVQAALGAAGTVTAHVPMALAITVGVVWLTAWSFRSAAPY